MLNRFFYIFFVLSFFACGSVAIRAQAVGADGKSLFGKNDGREEEMLKGVRETREKMRIEKEKKEHDEMLERGEEVRRLSERLEKSFAENGHFSDTDRTALETREKNAKKIRSELGGDVDDEKIDELLKAGDKTSFADAVDTLKNVATNLADELKKTTRFTISATAIQSSNAVLKLARFLRIKN